MRTLHRYSLLLSLSIGIANVAWAHPEYRVTIVGPANSIATDINSAGVVVGFYPVSATSTHAFLNRGRGVVDLGTLRGTASSAVAINDQGRVLGNWTTSSGQQRGFIYYRGRVRDIGVVPRRFTYYTDINNAGYITAIGQGADSSSPPSSYLRAPDGTFRNLGTLAVENPFTFGYALNNRNQVAGTSGPFFLPDPPTRAVIWTNGRWRDLGDFGGAPNVALGINDHGQATGYGAMKTNFREQHAFLYSNGRLTDIDGRTPDETTFSNGYGINNRGHVVGISDHLSGFIYRGRRMQSLNALIDPKLGWDIHGPDAINDAGQIAATGTRRGVQYAVRLDLIRPLAERAPDLPPDAETPLLAPEAVDEADAQAQPKEVEQAVQQ